MTVRECIRRDGWILEKADCIGCRFMVVHVSFLNVLHMLDEVSFDIPAYSVTDLENLFSDFCKENGFSKNTVQSVCIVAARATKEELLEVDM